MEAKKIKRWSIIFRALANPNRLKIIELLTTTEKMSVSEITEKLDIAFKATSNHLAILKNLDVIESQGKEGHIYYSLSGDLPKDFKKAIDIALKF